ncbi:MAG: glycoside hydrolase family 2 TIM barrel-domain containing protein [Prolixibacteraceae bacterium]|nr:glycoside hydrolase family 2 TIM barrel-domain containing protein [Prolixibacteraceae bacterium]
MKKTFVFLCLIIFTSGTQAQNISSYKKQLIANWQFLRQDIGGVWEAVRPTEPGSPQAALIWKDVTLPHCFNAFDAVDPDINYYQGPGWYRTNLKIENPYKKGRTLLHFEGAGQKTEVYIGLKKAATHVGGYDEWTVDITDLAKAETSNPLFKNQIPLSVRCDNSRDLQMIPSDLSDFNVYGGLYRIVNLVYVPESYIEQVHISPKISSDKKNGSIQLNGLLVNPSSKLVLINVKVIGQNNNVVETASYSIRNNEFNESIQLKNIQCWSPDHPNLYCLEIELNIDGDKQLYTDYFGFREFKFETKGPFYLNGERLLLLGTHRHEDHAGVGAAMTEPMIRKELKMIKEMGANFIRLGHYQQSRIVLNLCDSLGILVWEEIPWCRGGLGGEIYQQQARRMLTNMINQHYNHPSVIIWGLGNENDWPGDAPVYDKKAIQDFMSELNNLAHQLDNSRKTAIRRCDFCKDIVDVYSPSIWAGWYRGKYIEYMQESRKQMEQVDHFLHVEWGADSQAGRHSENPDLGLDQISTNNGTDERVGDASLVGGQARVSRDGDWTETYACNLYDWTLKEQEKMPWLTGSAFWTFKDFSTPIRPENPVPYVNQKGVVTRDLTPKEIYYVIQSYWTQKPMIHIYGHGWPIRWGDAGQARMVKVYSNCSEVELFLNGKSIGLKKRDSQNFPAAGLNWNVKFESGMNHLKAVSKVDEKLLSDEIDVRYQTEKWDVPATLQLEEIKIDKEFSWLEVSAKDKNQVLCLDARNTVEFSVAGDADLIDNLGTPTGSRVVQLCNGKAKIKIRKNGPVYSGAVQSSGLKTAAINAQ